MLAPRNASCTHQGRCSRPRAWGATHKSAAAAHGRATAAEARATAAQAAGTCARDAVLGRLGLPEAFIAKAAKPSVSIAGRARAWLQEGRQP